MAGDPSLLIGRNVETTVGELTNDMTKNNTKVILRINNVIGEIATTDLMGHELTTDYVRSIVKRQTSRIDANIEVKTKDKYVIRVKPTCFTIKRARSSQMQAIREMMVEIVKKRAAESDFENFMQEAILGDFQQPFTGRQSSFTHFAESKSEKLRLKLCHQLYLLYHSYFSD